MKKHPKPPYLCRRDPDGRIWISKSNLTREQGIRSLYGMYREINRLAYKGQMPTRVNISFARMRDLANMERHETTRNGVTRTRAVIRISTKIMSIKEAARELIHECVHVAHKGMKHGDAFEREMFRVRRKVFRYQLF